MKISVIIPTLNEARILRATLQRLRKGINLEIVVVDGGSEDDTISIAKEYTKKVYLSSPGRAIQMNEGARHAEGEILLFLHADSYISAGGIGKIIPAIIGLPAVGGAFQLAFNSRNVVIRLVAWFANLRARLTRVPYGDQGIFITKKVFQKIEGYPDLPIMEDVELAGRMKKEGKIALLKEKIFTSPRRWEKEGILFTTFRNRALMIGYLLGIPPQRLATCYKNIR
jgi:rSAM/selenodomain-associated transferase 2